MPNKQAYNETCAAIALAMWNQRMFLLHGDSKYIDVLERVLYNGLLSGVSLEGDKFFYPNPLACDGRTPFNQGTLGRAPWFACSCCPGNVARFMPSLPGYVYATRNKAIYVNLFIGGNGRVPLADQTVRLSQTTRYPWDGAVELTVEPEHRGRIRVACAHSGLGVGKPVPSDLYRYAEPATEPVSLSVNGQPVAFQIHHGYAVLGRQWSAGDKVELRLPMPIHRVLADDPVAADRGRVALERGPIVYCFEAVDDRSEPEPLDKGDGVSQARLSDDMQLAHLWQSKLGGVEVIQGEAERGRIAAAWIAQGAAGPNRSHSLLRLGHRKVGEMAVGCRASPGNRRRRLLRKAGPGASHTYELDTPTALNDQLDPASSDDDSVPRFTWWNHLGLDRIGSSTISTVDPRAKRRGLLVRRSADRRAVPCAGVVAQSFTARGTSGSRLAAHFSRRSKWIASTRKPSVP